ncbi:PREDICTED: uncharacterized protein LOC105565335 [Vollenhovia emeryi]|uniref:uncharacterized protein LOC105565335 n=1 Tax=Vollenhovia emeryi TaxID=411798 RepID=UPI0005F5696E|nr:PREDICTED: uncharacterized protein LOC105565335 [Vollenhovia emeryi]
MQLLWTTIFALSVCGNVMSILQNNNNTEYKTSKNSSINYPTMLRVKLKESILVSITVTGLALLLIIHLWILMCRLNRLHQYSIVIRIRAASGIFWQRCVDLLPCFCRRLQTQQTPSEPNVLQNLREPNDRNTFV